MCKTHFSLLVCTLLVLCDLIGGQPTVEIEAEHAETVPNRAFINKIQFDEAFHQLESKVDELRNRIDGLQDDCVTNDKKNHYSTEGRFKCEYALLYFASLYCQVQCDCQGSCKNVTNVKR